jgi:hypothetical protein
MQVIEAGDDAVTAVTRTYRVFARQEVRGRSPAYEALAESVADDATLVIYHSSVDELLCVLARDGRGMALADGHGTWLQWLP